MIAKYRSSLPQLSSRMFLTDGGMETTLIFREGVTLPNFAAFDLLKTDEGTAMLRAVLPHLRRDREALRNRPDSRECHLAR